MNLLCKKKIVYLFCFCEEYDVHYYVYLIQGTFIIVFQGTVNMTHLKVDLDYELTDIENNDWIPEEIKNSCGNCEVHSGFLVTYFLYDLKIGDFYYFIY